MRRLRMKGEWGCWCGWPRKFRCDVCDAEFCSWAGLVAHVKVRHPVTR